jgi:hypothetical protein
MCGVVIGRTMSRTASRPDKERNMPLIQFKFIDGVFTAPQTRELGVAANVGERTHEQEATMQTPTVHETRRAGQKPRTTRALVVQSLLLGIGADEPKNGMGAR